MEVQRLQDLLRAGNPWWRTARWEAEDVALQRLAAAGYEYRPGSLDALEPGGLYLLRGPRRVGKSTELKRAIAGLLAAGVPARQVLHASVEGWRAADLADLVRFADERLLRGAAGGRWWFLDEITAVHGDWPSEVKRLRDQHPGFAFDTVVLTGSNAAGLEAATKGLAGRRGPATHADRVLLPMPFTAFCAAVGVGLPESPPVRAADLMDGEAQAIADDLAPWTEDLVRAWETYLAVGGYPQAVTHHLRAPEAGPDPSLVDALWDVIQGEAFARAGLAHVQAHALLRGIARSLGSSLAVSALARDADVAPPTAAARLEDLRRAFLCWPVHREQGLAPKPRSQGKWYFGDPLVARLAALRGAGRAPDVTALSEEQIGVALLRSLERESPGAAARHDQLLHHRSATGAEIDFVAAQFGAVCVESKYVDAGWGRALQTARASPWPRSIVATRAGVGRQADSWALPSGMLAVLLGG